eukprot:366313-Chlamydomonas_euryale.AAC.11
MASDEAVWMSVSHCHAHVEHHPRREPLQPRSHQAVCCVQKNSVKKLVVEPADEARTSERTCAWHVNGHIHMCLHVKQGPCTWQKPYLPNPPVQLPPAVWPSAFRHGKRI